MSVQWQLDGPGFASRRGQKKFLFSETSRPALGRLRPLTCWDCGFELRRGHGCLYLVT